MPGTYNRSQTFCNKKPEFHEELLECPYNSSHQIRPERMIRHLVICRKDCLSSKTNPYFKKAKQIVICQFNSVHHVHKDDLEKHLQECESAALYKETPGIEEKLSVMSISKGPDSDTNVLESKENVEEESEEDWDKEMSGVELSTYDPMIKVVEKNLAINTRCKSAGERKDIRAMQRVDDKEGLEYLLAPASKNKKKKKKPAANKYVPVGM